jgi:hypothetical protein
VVIFLRTSGIIGQLARHRTKPRSKLGDSVKMSELTRYLRQIGSETDDEHTGAAVGLVKAGADLTRFNIERAARINRSLEKLRRGMTAETVRRVKSDGMSPMIAGVDELTERIDSRLDSRLRPRESVSDWDDDDFVTCWRVLSRVTDADVGRVVKSGAPMTLLNLANSGRRFDATVEFGGEIIPGEWYHENKREYSGGGRRGRADADKPRGRSVRGASCQRKTNKHGGGRSLRACRRQPAEPAGAGYGHSAKERHGRRIHDRNHRRRSGRDNRHGSARARACGTRGERR